MFINALEKKKLAEGFIHGTLLEEFVTMAQHNQINQIARCNHTGGIGVTTASRAHT